MPSRISVHRRLARNVANRAEESAVRHRQATIGTVIGVSPFRVELHDSSTILEEGVDMLVSQWVQFYHTTWGIHEGDNALVDKRHGHYVWHDMLSGTDCSPSSATVPWT